MKQLPPLQRALTVVMNKLAWFIGHPYVFAGFLTITVIYGFLLVVLEYELWFDIIDIFIFTVSFFILFILQNSQNAEMRAIQDKLDEIIDKLPGADVDKEKEEELLKRGGKIE